MGGVFFGLGDGVQRLLDGWVVVCAGGVVVGLLKGFGLGDGILGRKGRREGWVGQRVVLHRM